MNDYAEHFTDSRRFVVAFGGGHQNRFEWHRTLSRLGISHVCMRDTTQRYYQHGVIGIGDQKQTIEYLRTVEATKHSTYIGVSSAGYAALLYAAKVSADEVIIISGLTGRELDGWPPEDHQFIWGPTDPPMEDIRPLYLNVQKRPYVHAFVSDGEGCRLDMQMARRIKPDLIQIIPGHEHRHLAAAMRDMGLIDELLR